jgi:hypothetical protein
MIHAGSPYGGRQSRRFAGRSSEIQRKRARFAGPEPVEQEVATVQSGWNAAPQKLLKFCSGVVCRCAGTRPGHSWRVLPAVRFSRVICRRRQCRHSTFSVPRAGEAATKFGLSRAAVELAFLASFCQIVVATGRWIVPIFVVFQSRVLAGVA